MVAPSQGDWFADGEAYELYVGRWSRKVGPIVLGTGSLYRQASVGSTWAAVQAR